MKELIKITTSFIAFAIMSGELIELTFKGILIKLICLLYLFIMMKGDINNGTRNTR